MADSLVNCFQTGKFLPMSCLALSLLADNILLFSKANALTFFECPFIVHYTIQLTRVANVAIFLLVNTSVVT